VDKLAEKFVELTKEILKTAGKTQDLNLALKLNVGPEKAEAIGKLAESFEQTTRFDAGDIKGALLPLVKENISDVGTLDALTTIATDIAARENGGIESVQKTLGAFATIFQRGRLKPAMLEQFGIQTNEYFDELGASLGVSASAAEKMAKQGKVAQDKLVDVAVNMVAARQGGAIGGPSLEANTTMGATLAHLSNASDNLFERIADGPGVKAIQGVLDRLVEVLSGSAGDKLMSAVDATFTQLAAVITPDRVEAFVTGIAAGLDYIRSINFGPLLSFFSAIGSVLGAVFGVLKEIWGLLSDLGVFDFLIDQIRQFGEMLQMVFEGWGYIFEGVRIGIAYLREGLVAIGTFLSGFVDQVWGWATDIGTRLWQGIKEGILGGISAVEDAVSNLGNSLVSKLKGLLGIHSPSAVMMEMGDYTAEGFALGLEGGTDRVGDAARSSLNDAALGGTGGGGTSIGGASISYAPVLQFTGGGGGGGDIRQQAEEANQILRDGFVRLLEEIGLTTGAQAA
jgi:hypothetical protein